MAKDKEQGIKGTTTAKPAIEITVGDEFSLNLNKIPHLYIDDIIKLDFYNPFCVVPDDALPSLLIRLEKERRLGYIIKGHVDTRPKKDQEVLEFYLKALDLRMYPQIREYIIGVAKTRTRISGWKPKEILEAMLKKEVGNNNRRQVVDLLREAIRLPGEPSLADVPFNKELHTKAKYESKRPGLRPATKEAK